MPQLLVRKRAILAKIEAVYGTDPVPTGAANSILVRAPIKVTPLSSNLVPRDVVRAYLGNSENLPGPVYVTLEIEVEIAGASAAGTAPAYGPLLRACGFAETINGGVSVVYAPVSAAFESVTIYCNYDGVLHKLTGARGTVSVDLTVGQIPVYKFRFMGLFSAVTDTALPTQVFTAWVKPLSVNNVNTTGLSIHGLATAVMSQLSIDTAGRPSFRSLVGGAESVPYTDRRPAGAIKLEAVSIATKDWFTIAKNATLGAFSITQGTVAGNKVKLDAPSVQVTNPNYEDDSDGITMLNMGLVLVPGSAGNDEFTITVL